MVEEGSRHVTFRRQNLKWEELMQQPMGVNLTSDRVQFLWALEKSRQYTTRS
jgi:hypothetical protein